MLKHKTLEELFAPIANTIRGQTGASGEIIADDFPDILAGLFARLGKDVLTLATDINGTPYATVADLKTAVASAVAAIGPNATWAQVQYYIINSAVVDAGTAQDISDEYYWWGEGSKTPIDRFAGIVDDYIDGAINDADLKSAVISYFPQMNIYLGTIVATLKPWASSVSLQAAMQTKVVNLAKSLKSRSMTAEANVTWYTLQYYGVFTNVMNGTGTVPVTPTAAYAYYMDTINGTWAPPYASPIPEVTQ